MFVYFFFLLSSFHIINLSLIDFSCRQSDINRTIEIGDEVTLCLHSKELKRKVAFKIKVDEYTILTINDGFEKLIPEAIQPEPEPENTTHRYRRRMVYDPNSIDEKQNNLGDNEPTTPTPTETPTQAQTQTPVTPPTTIIPPPSPTPTTTITDIPTIQPTEEIIIDNPDDKSKIVAQIGDKITQYPGVIYFFII